MEKPAESTIIRQPDGRLMDLNPRCWRCAKLIGVRLSHPWEIICTRCHARNRNATEIETVLAETHDLTSADEGAIMSKTSP